MAKDNQYEYEEDGAHYAYSDDIVEENLPRKRRYSLKLAISVALISVGAAVASGINLGVDSALEFGQGILGVKACTPSLNVTPITGYVNTQSGMFTLDAVDVTGIPDSCIGNDFTIKVWDQATNTALFVTDSSNSADGLVNYVKVSMLSDKSFQLVGTPNVYLDVLDTSTAMDNQISIVYDAGSLTGDLSRYADSRNVYKVTVETAKTE